MCDYYLIKSESSSRKCQCCLSENNLKNMMDNFIFEGKIEVYSEMIKECFAIKITDDESADYFICDLCILKLRDSCNFRNQVDRVQSKLKKKNDKDSTADTSLTDMLETLRKMIKPSILTELDDKPSNIVKTLSPQENIDEQESSPEDEFLYFVEIKPLESEETKYVFEKDTKKLNLLPEIKKEGLRKIIKSSIPTEQDDEPSKEDYSIDNVIINSNGKHKLNSSVKHAGKNRSKEKIKRFRRRDNARSIPYKIDKADLTCKICNETFMNNKNLMKHMPEHYPNLVCHICGKFALNAHQLSAHLRTHNPEQVACHICNKVMKKTSILRHVQMHTGDHFIHACKKCPEKFSSYSSRVKHMVDVHQVEVQKHKCKSCPKAFRYSGTLSIHVRSFHLQERSISCPECGKLFFRKTEMQQHMVKHTKEKNFQCALCLKSYGRKSSLCQHMKIHNNEKQYKCIICERTFTQKCTLKGHVKIHEKSNIQLLSL